MPLANAAKKSTALSDALVITVAGVGAEVTRAQQPHLPLLAGGGRRRVPTRVRRRERRSATSTAGGRTGPDAGSRDVSGLRRGDPRAVVRSSSSSRRAGPSAWASRSASRRSSLKPDMATLTLGTCNFGDDVFENSLPTIRTILERIRQYGITPELEIFDDGMLATADALFARDS